MRNAANKSDGNLQVLKAHVSVPTVEAIEDGKNSNIEKQGQETLHLCRHSLTIKRSNNSRTRFPQTGLAPHLAKHPKA